MADLVLVVVGVGIVAAVAVISPLSLKISSSGDSYDMKIPELEEENVRMRDKAEVYRKIRTIIEGTKDKLQIITDFDRTVSKHHHNGVPTPSSYAVFEKVPSLPKSYIEKANAVYNKYRVYEEDPHMTVEEKIPYMEDWWRENEKLYIGLPYNETEIEIAVNKSDIHLRLGSDDAFHKLHKFQVPVLVFSAGLGAVVETILKQHHLLSNNVHVISNFFNVDNGTITGFNNGTVLHIFNKNAHAIENSEYFRDVSQRPNVILMGDSIGDANMDEGVQGDAVVLKIGFLSLKIDEFLPQYLDKFDVVLLDDQTMDVFNALIDRIP